MNRGDALKWGLSITTDGKVFKVNYEGTSEWAEPDHVFDTFEAMIEWLEDQHEGYKISGMGKPK